MSRRARFFIHGGALALVVLVVYAWLAPTHVVDGDNAELSMVGAIGGRAHPSGYPAYVLLLRALSWLPGASPAHTAALATVLVAVGVVAVLHAACRAWGASPAAATFAVAIYAASPVVLRMHTEAEVFAMNALVVGCVLWLAASGGPLRGIARAAVLGGVAGIGLANHLTCALVAPVGLLGIVRAVRETSRPKLLPIAAAVGMLAVGLSLYLYLFVADGPASFGRVDTFSDLVDFVLRKDYGGPGAFLPTDKPVSTLDNLRVLAMTLGRGWLWLPGVLGVVELVRRMVRSGTGEPRSGWIVLAVSFIVAGPLLVLRFNMPPTGLGLYVAQRFHLLPLELLALPVACGLDWIAAKLPLRSERLRSPRVLTALGVIVFIAATTATWPWLRAVHSPAMEIEVRNMLRSLPADAVVVANSDDLCIGAEYLQHARGERPDVVVACWILTSRSWYRDRLAAHGVQITGDFTLELSASQAESIIASGRPLFVDRSQKALAHQLPNYPHGILIRVLRHDDRPPPLPEVVQLNRGLYEHFDLDYPKPDRSADYATLAHKRYAATWMTLSAALDAAGDHDGAKNARDVAVSLAPAAD